MGITISERAKTHLSFDIASSNASLWPYYQEFEEYSLKQNDLHSYSHMLVFHSRAAAVLRCCMHATQPHKNKKSSTLYLGPPTHYLESAAVGLRNSTNNSRAGQFEDADSYEVAVRKHPDERCGSWHLPCKCDYAWSAI